ncbi:MAG TPA: hypothetical protein VJL29_04135 [Thermoguttaceae bacterium]|nr:hypothetical protein [Thermoguttaceae bacterium]
MRYWFWIVWAAVLIVMAGLQFSAASAAQPTVAPRATYSSLSREQIRQMPLLERPNRPGHFYGNTVRWLNGRRSGGYRGR